MPHIALYDSRAYLGLFRFSSAAEKRISCDGQVFDPEIIFLINHQITHVLCSISSHPFAWFLRNLTHSPLRWCLCTSKAAHFCKRVWLQEKFCLSPLSTKMDALLCFGKKLVLQGGRRRRRRRGLALTWFSFSACFHFYFDGVLKWSVGSWNPNIPVDNSRLSFKKSSVFSLVGWPKLKLHTI